MRGAAALAVFLLLAFGAAAFGAIFPPGPWYAALAKPSWTPPNWLFGPVWTALYIMMAVAAWLVYRRTGSILSAPLLLWTAQLLLNALWSWLFFGLRRPGLAFAEIVLMALAILACTLAFAQVRRPAALLMVPYLAWVSFAAALNFALWRLNR